MSKALLSIENLHVAIDENEILKGVDLSINQGEIHAIMGPNGSGKSTLTYVLMGHPRYNITQGKIYFDAEDLSLLSVDQRARKGIFLAFQYPFEVDGVPVKDFLRQAYNACYAGTSKQIGLKDFKILLQEKMDLLGINQEFIERSLNVGCSGGEKKRIEMLQIAVLQPRFIVLDEIDSGLDIDALRVVCDALNIIKAASPTVSIMIITHYKRILEYIIPDRVHVMQAGIIQRSGQASLVDELEKSGYQQ